MYIFFVDCFSIKVHPLEMLRSSIEEKKGGIIIHNMIVVLELAT